MTLPRGGTDTNVPGEAKLPRSVINAPKCPTVDLVRRYFFLAFALPALVLPASSYGHATERVGLREGWRVIDRETEDDVNGPYRVDSCRRQARGYRVRCRATSAWGLADDGRMTATDLVYATKDRGGYHVTERDYDYSTRGDGRGRCDRAVQACPPQPGVSDDWRDGWVRVLGASGDTTAWLGAYDSLAASNSQLVVASEDGVERPERRIDTPALDVGPRDGREQVVYSQCNPRPCELRRYDPQTKTESGLPRTSSANCRESAPALWGKTLVFSRETIPDWDGPKCETGIYRQTGDGRPRLVHRTPGGVDVTVKDMDVAGGALAYLLYRGSDGRHEVWLRAGRSDPFERIHSEIIYLPRHNPIHDVDIAGSHVYWTTGSDEDGGDDRSKRIFRRSLSGGPTERATGTFAFYSAAFTAEWGFYGDERGIHRVALPYQQWVPE